MIKVIVSLAVIAALGGWLFTADYAFAQEDSTDDLPFSEQDGPKFEFGLDYRDRLSELSQPVTYGGFKEIFGPGYWVLDNFGLAIEYDTVSPYPAQSSAGIRHGDIFLYLAWREEVEDWRQDIESAEIGLIVYSVGDDPLKDEILWPDHLAGPPTEDAIELVFPGAWELINTGKFPEEH